MYYLVMGLLHQWDQVSEAQQDTDDAQLHHLSLAVQVSTNCCLILFGSKVSILSCITFFMPTRNHDAYEYMRG